MKLLLVLFLIVNTAEAKKKRRSAAKESRGPKLERREPETWAPNWVTKMICQRPEGTKCIPLPKWDFMCATPSAFNGNQENEKKIVEAAKACKKWGKPSDDGKPPPEIEPAIHSIKNFYANQQLNISWLDGRDPSRGVEPKPEMVCYYKSVKDANVEFIENLWQRCRQWN